MSISDDEVEAALAERPFGKATVGELLLYGRGTPNPKDTMRAALSAAAKVRAIREGDGEWVMVPREPLPEMLAAWYRYKNGHHWADEPAPKDTSDYGAYRAMIAASPATTGGEKE